MLTRIDRPTPDFANFHLPATLADGTPVLIRAVRPDDGPKIRRAFHTLRPETIHARFFDSRAEVTAVELAQIARVDFKRDAALLVTVGTGDDEIIVGGASYFALDGATPPRSGELAFTIVEAYQGRGLGRLLLREMVAIARTNGLATLEADMLADNIPALTLFRHSGLPMTLRRDANLLHVRLALSAAQSASSATATSPSAI
jgi:GNAT superfamily N-acetyltransferase